MEKKISCGLFGIHFIYDNVDFEHFICGFPEYASKEIMDYIKVQYKYGSIDENLKKTDCNFDLDPSLIKGYQRMENNHGDILLLHEGLLIIRDFEQNAIQFINENPCLIVDLSGFIETFIANVLYKWNYLAVHGAALVCQGKGIAFVGKSCSGKSTTVMQLLKQATGILSNDLFYLDFEDNNIYSMDKTFGFRENSFHFLQNMGVNWEAETIIYESEQKYYDLEKITGINYIKKAQLRIIVFCSVEKRANYCLRKINGVEVFQNLMNSCIHLSQFVNVNYLKIYSLLEDRYNFYKLELPDFNSSTQLLDNIFSDNFVENLFGRK